MTKAELRKEPRIPRGRKGTLIIAGMSVSCVVQDLSTKGFLIMCTRPFPVGTELELKSELYPERFMTCKIRVRHVSDMCLGTEIVEMSESSLRLCREFIEEHYSERPKFG
jgi:hypothetical protein